MDLIFLLAERKEQLARLGTLERYLRRDGAIWVVSPRGQPHLNEAHVLAAGKAAGLVDVKVVYFSETHTAHKMVIPLARRSAAKWFGGSGAGGGMKRCGWASNDPLLLEYHDREWGVPVHDDPKLFEFLILGERKQG